MHRALNVRSPVGNRPGIRRSVAAVIGAAAIACTDAAVEPPPSNISPSGNRQPLRNAARIVCVSDAAAG